MNPSTNTKEKIYGKPRNKNIKKKIILNYVYIKHVFNTIKIDDNLIKICENGKYFKYKISCLGGKNWSIILPTLA